MCPGAENDAPDGERPAPSVLVDRLREGRLRDGDDPRVIAAWRSWLSALATDAEAAIAAAMAYGSLGDAARDAWLDALDADGGEVKVSPIALYAPLLAVEADAGRRVRMMEAMATGAPPTTRAAEALRGEADDGECVCIVTQPLYLDFVEMLVCRYRPEEGILAAHHDPMRHAEDAPRVAVGEAEGLSLTPVPLPVVVEELAHAVVADRRRGREAPAALARFSHLFGPDLARREADEG